MPCPPAYYNSAVMYLQLKIGLLWLILKIDNVQFIEGAAVAEWLNCWLAEQEDRGSIPGFATWIFRDWLSPASKSRYGWNTAEAT